MRNSEEARDAGGRLGVEGEVGGSKAGGEAVQGQVGPQALVDLGFPPKRNGEPLEGVEQSRV